MVGQIIFYLIFAILTQILTYKIIRKIDKKERKKLFTWEQRYIELLNEVSDKDIKIENITNEKLEEIDIKSFIKEKKKKKVVEE